MPTRTIAQVIAGLPPGRCEPLPFPAWPVDRLHSLSSSQEIKRIGLAVDDMRFHTSDEGWQIFNGLQMSGYELHGFNLGPSLTDVRKILELSDPDIVMVQDKLEFDRNLNTFREPRAHFTNLTALKERKDRFIVTIRKDSHSRVSYNREFAEEIGAHAFVVYYHPKIVHHLCPFLRPDNIIRTYHSVNPEDVLPYSPDDRTGTLLSGAVSNAYPLRQKLFGSTLVGMTTKKHPGYHNRGTCTPDFLKELSRFRVSICTSSIFGYALRKIMESTAAGCIVLTDLPEDEVLPGGIDANLVRITSEMTPIRIGNILRELYDCYDPERQRHFAELALAWYNTRSVGQRLAHDIDRARREMPVNDTLQRRVKEIFPRGGYYVEAGAHDGIGDSQTLWLEQLRNWDGLCIEPGISGDSLRNNRKCEVDRRCLAGRDGWVTFRQVFGDHVELSGIVGHFYDHWDRLSYQHEDKQVEAITLTRMFAEHATPPIIDFLCLDTEGSECDILAAHDFERYKILSMWVEHNNVDSHRDKIRSLILPKGYREELDTGHDLLLVHNSIPKGKVLP